MKLREILFGVKMVFKKPEERLNGRYFVKPKTRYKMETRIVLKNEMKTSFDCNIWFFRLQWIFSYKS